MFNICIVGGGASGMTAAIAAAEKNPDLKIILLEKNSGTGKKLLATGNGRCNLSNSEIENHTSVTEFFQRTGIFIRTEEQGRMYPYSGKAADVVKALNMRIQTLGIKVLTNFIVTSIERVSKGFSVTGFSGENILSENIILATGGKAGPQYGCTGDGYQLAKKFGHEIARLAPGLTWLSCREYNESLKGTRIKAKVSLIKKKAVIGMEVGEVQFTAQGVSGICIFNLSNLLNLDFETDFSDYTVSIDFMPDYTIDETISIVRKRTQIKGISMKDLLLSVVPEVLALEILECASVKELKKIGRIADIDGKVTNKIAELLKDFRCSVSGAGGWKDAQVTRGGIKANEINPYTKESLLVPGLYFAGELLDYAGPCGGFNLHHAWKTGLTAGQHSAGACLGTKQE